MDWPSRLFITRLLDQSFGMCITPEDLLIPFFNQQGTSYFRPWKFSEVTANKDAGSTIDNTSDKFKISLDVQHFKPDEISVKVNNNEIIIEGKHEERKDEHGFISRQFVRKYALPKDCISESIISTLSSDGVLCMTASKKITKVQASAKTVPITTTGPCRKIQDAEEKKTSMGINKMGNCEMKGTQTNECELKKETKNEYEIKNENKNGCEMNSENKNKCVIKKENKKDCGMKKECEMKNHGEMKKETMNECKIQTGEKDQKDCQLMLKEEHSRLLKPELLGEATATLNTEKLISESKKETDELLKLISGDKTVLTPAAEKLDEVIGQCKTAISELKKEKAEAMSVLSEMSNMAASEMSSMKSTMMSETVEVTMSSSSSKTSTEKTSDIVSEIICAELKEAATEIL